METIKGVSKTLFVPLVARIAISKQFPEYFYDVKALELEKILPTGAKKGSSEYSNMASVARYYTMDKMVEEFFNKHEECNIVYLGVGLETAYDRLYKKVNNKKVHWFEIDLPEVIQTRNDVFKKRENETCIAGDMFQMQWIEMLDCSLPTLLIVSGVFQYFHEDVVVDFIKNCKYSFLKGEIIFDATNQSGLKFTNWFIKRTGNSDALMYFYINDSALFAKKCSVILLSEKTFFPDALSILKKKLSFVTKISMKIAESKKQVLILHLQLNT